MTQLNTCAIHIIDEWKHKLIKQCFILNFSALQTSITRTWVVNSGIHLQGLFSTFSFAVPCRRNEMIPPIGEPQACIITVRKPNPIKNHMRIALTPIPSIPTQKIIPAIKHPQNRNIHSLLIPNIAIFLNSRHVIRSQYLPNKLSLYKKHGGSVAKLSNKLS